MEGKPLVALYLIVLAAVIALASIAGFVFLNAQKPYIPPIHGFLFSAGEKYYLVSSGSFLYKKNDWVMTQEEITKESGLKEIYPPASDPKAKPEVALNSAAPVFLQDVKTAKRLLDDFNMQDCLSSHADGAPEKANQACNDMLDQAEKTYAFVSGAQLKEPYLIYNESGKPTDYIIYAINNGNVVSHYLVDADSGKYECHGFLTLEWQVQKELTQDKAKEFLASYLAENKIDYDKIAGGRRIYYFGKVCNGLYSNLVN